MKVSNFMNLSTKLRMWQVAKGWMVFTHVRCWEFEPLQCLSCHLTTVVNDSFQLSKDLINSKSDAANHKNFLLLNTP